MPGQTMSTWKTSMSLDRAARSCWNSASRSVALGGVETSETAWPVRRAQASAPSRQSSASIPTEPQAIVTVVRASAAQARAAIAAAITDILIGVPPVP